MTVFGFDGIWHYPGLPPGPVSPERCAVDAATGRPRRAQGPSQPLAPRAGDYRTLPAALGQPIGQSQTARQTSAKLAGYRISCDAKDAYWSNEWTLSGRIRVEFSCRGASRQARSPWARTPMQGTDPKHQSRQVPKPHQAAASAPLEAASMQRRALSPSTTLKEPNAWAPMRAQPWPPNSPEIREGLEYYRRRCDRGALTRGPGQLQHHVFLQKHRKRCVNDRYRHVVKACILLLAPGLLAAAS